MKCGHVLKGDHEGRNGKTRKLALGYLGALKLDDMYHLACAKIATKTASGFQVEGLQDCFTTMRENSAKSQGPKTRLQLSNCLVKPQPSKKKWALLPSYQVPRVWNEVIPEAIRIKGSRPIESALDPAFKPKSVLNSLDTAFKRHVLSEYERYKCQKTNCYSCKM